MWQPMEPPVSVSPCPRPSQTSRFLESPAGGECRGASPLGAESGWSCREPTPWPARLQALLLRARGSRWLALVLDGRREAGKQECGGVCVSFSPETYLSGSYQAQHLCVLGSSERRVAPLIQPLSSPAAWLGVGLADSPA